MKPILYLLTLVLLCATFSSHAQEDKKAKCKLHYKYSKRSASKGLMRGSCEIHYKEASSITQISVKLVHHTETGSSEELISLSRDGSRTFNDTGNRIMFSVGEIAKDTEVSISLHPVDGESIACELEKVNNHPKNQ